MKWSTFALPLLMVAAIGLSYQAWYKKQQPAVPQTAAHDLQTGTYLGSMEKTLPSFNLVSAKGHGFTKGNLINRWSFVFFGYTRCPELCPRTLGIMQQLSEQLGSASHTQYILISLDPTHDTPASLREYFSRKPYDGLPFEGVTGDQQQILALAETLGLFVQSGGVPADQSHLEHSGSLLLFNPKGQLVALFSQPDNPKALARDFQKILKIEARKVL